VADGRWRISVTPPDWGQDHLSSEAIAAFVDGELAPGPRSRAAAHLRQCPDCATQVAAQGQASSALRAAGCPILSSALLSSLRAIPQDADLPGPPSGLAMTSDGQFVSVVRGQPDGFRTSAAAPEHHSAVRSGRSPMQRRLRIGTGVAVSGLALGALAFGAPATSSAPASPAPPSVADRGAPGPVLGGSPGVLDARLQLGSVASSTRSSGPGAVGFDR
jgi:anti-sigma factor RsiW